MFDYDERRVDSWDDSLDGLDVREYLSDWLSWKDTFYVERGW